MRRKPNSQNRQSKITDGHRHAAEQRASPSRPIAAVATTPSSGVVRLASIAGPAMANTSRVCVGLADGAVVDFSGWYLQHQSSMVIPSLAAV